MKKSGIILLITTVLIGTIMFTETAITNSFIPPVSRTGAPLEGDCGSCHGNLNTGPGDILFSLDSLAYIPDSTYDITVQVIDDGRVRFGFQITVLDSNDKGVGSFIITYGANTSPQSNLGREYVNQKGADTTNTWSFAWTAPDTNIGPVTFYIAGNASNNNSGISGDRTYTRSFIMGPCGISITDSVKGSYNDSSGMIFLTPVGGFGPYTYLWSNGSTQEDIDSLAVGDYSVTLTDGSGCIDSATITIQNWCGFTITDSTKGSYSDSSGAIDITVIGSMGPYAYLWSNGSTQEDLDSLAGGDYTVTVTDGNGCVEIATITVQILIGAGEIKEELTWVIYPNPSSGQFSILGSNSDKQTQIIVYNLQGDIVYQLNDLKLFGGQVIDLSGLSAGIYTLSLSNKEEAKYKRIVIQ